MPKSLSNTKLAQVALVVRDIEASSAKWASLLGQPIPTPFTTKPGDEVNQKVKGLPSDAQCKLAFFDLGGVQLELIQPLGGESSWQQGLDDSGEGFHHLAFWTENMQEAAEAMGEAGAPLWHVGDMGDEGQFAYFDAREELGVTVEFLESKKTPL